MIVVIEMVIMLHKIVLEYVMGLQNMTVLEFVMGMQQVKTIVVLLRLQMAVSFQQIIYMYIIMLYYLTQVLI